jgi:hypothetical protein
MKEFNNYTTGRTQSVFSKQLWRYVIVLLLGLLISSPAVLAQKGKSPSASLEQIRNGGADKPVDPAQWQNGNAGNQTAHYVEGHSIGYRVLLSDLPASTTVELIMAYDIRHSSKNAIDFLTHYDRLQPHGQFTVGGLPHTNSFPDNDELVDPRLGTAFAGAAPTAPDPVSANIIPRPAVNTGGDVPGVAYDRLPDAERRMTMWGATINSISYDGAANLADAQSEQRIKIIFTTSSTGGSAVLAWGGHIASRVDWGYTGNVPNSAGGISGSPYHMRLKEWTIGNLGNQDRSLAAAAVIAPPGCALTGYDDVCAGSINAYSTSVVADRYEWTILNSTTNTSGAYFTSSATSTDNLGASRIFSTNSPVYVNAGATAGSYTVKLVTVRGGVSSTDVCEILVRVYKVEKPSFTIQDASLCGSATASITICNPIVGVKYVVTQDAGGAASQEVTYSGIDPLVFSGLAPGKNVSIVASVTVDNNAICSATSTCSDKVTQCPELRIGTSSLQSESSSSLKGVEPTKIDENVTAFPVPFSRKTTVEFKLAKSERYEINLYDMRGNLVKQLKSGKAKAGELQQVEVDGANLAEGMYLVRVVSSQGAKTVKLLKKE